MINLIYHKAGGRSAAFLACAIFLTTTTLRAQLGNDNPTGPTGVFNGNVTTGCSYDPMTGNATRSITDLAVAGGVGEYPLAFGRTTNSRNQEAGWFGFGQAGGWRHSYAWEIAGAETFTSLSARPTVYHVYFPDGRVIPFWAQGGPYFRSAPGVKERFQPLNANLIGYLLLADGGKIEFKATRHVEECNWEVMPPCTYYFTYQAKAVIDPYGMRTTLTYNSDGSLNTIQEPAGRWLQLVYVNTPWVNPDGQPDRVIDHVKASDGREVKYNYGQMAPGTRAYTYLGNVVYPFEATLGLSPTAFYTYDGPNGPEPNGYPLLRSCDDPMYAGPMKKISYSYATSNGDPLVAVVAGQILSENHFNAAHPFNAGQVVSRLYIPYITSRTEIRGDGPFRTFIYNGAFLWKSHDFKQQPTQYWRDTNNGYLIGVTDPNGNKTDFVNESYTGKPTLINYPLTPNDTPPGTPRGKIAHAYGGPTCHDAYNQDDNNPYYRCSTTDEAGNVTRFTRDANKRVVRVDYPDNSFETFSYNSFGQVLSHLMKTGGTETFTYAGSVKQSYSDPYHATGNPTARYQYDLLGRLSGVTGPLGTLDGDPNYTVNYEYNQRGQVTVTKLSKDPTDGLRHTISNTYNPNGDGTLLSTTDPLGHITTYTYDDYRRIRSVTTPQRSPGDSTPRTTYFSYDRYQTSSDDYTHTDANVTRLTLPSGKLVRKAYDPNRRKLSETASAADEVTDSAATGFEYDNAGNLRVVKRPDPQTGQPSVSRATTYNYDERNRLSSTVDALGHATSCKYDAGGRKYFEQQPDGQTITHTSYDSMNRILETRVTQAPTADAITNYTWWPSGLLHTIQDPRGKVYTYQYDLMGRKTSLTYPPDSANVVRSEAYTYNAITGNLDTFANRAGNVQTFVYDTLNRTKQFSWNDGFTPIQTFSYDAASRPIRIWNWHATIDFEYFNDGLLRLEKQTITTPNFGDNVPRTVEYSYDADGNRKTLKYPMGFIFDYGYTGRNQLKNIDLPSIVGFGSIVNYTYDAAGNRRSRTLNQGTVTTYEVDELDRAKTITHTWGGGQAARFDYGFDTMSRKTYEQRTPGLADGFGYDLAGQLTAYNRDGTLNPVTGIVANANGASSLHYDASGNRTAEATNGITYLYGQNNLNQYTSYAGGQLTYDQKGNLDSLGGWTVIYDAQNRLRSASNATTSLQFWYDGLNRQITRRIDLPGEENDKITFNVWDGWNLLEERGLGNTPQEYYGHGADTDELLAHWGGGYGTNWYGYDGRGNTSHVFNNANQLVERYTYDFGGRVTTYVPSGGVLPNGSAVDTRHLFQGRQLIKEAGVYDFRNRFYCISIGRFLQPDPIGFAGGDTNLYRYCGGDPVNGTDPLGLEGRFYGDLNKVPRDGPLTPREQLFFTGAINFSLGTISLAGLATVEVGSLGWGTPAVVLGAYAAGGLLSAGAAQMISAVSGTPSQQQGSTMIPTTASTAAGLVLPAAAADGLNALEATLALNSALKNFSSGLGIASAIDVAASTTGLVQAYQRFVASDPFDHISVTLATGGLNGTGGVANNFSGGTGLGLGFGPFSPSSNSFTNSNGDSLIPGFGEGGFLVISGGGYDFYPLLDEN